MKNLLLASIFTLTASSSVQALTVTQAEKWMQYAKGNSGSSQQAKCGRGKIYDTKKRKCVVKSAATLDDKSKVMAGVWMAKAGHHVDAIDTLELVKDKKNTIAQTYIGYSHRKLGHNRTALKHYAAALSSDRKNWIARSYLGEAHIARGDLNAARLELSLIKTGCGVDCSTYKRLAGALVLAKQPGSSRTIND